MNREARWTAAGAPRERRSALRSMSTIGVVLVASVGMTLAAGTASASAEGCSSTCFVGGAGNGGESSGGAAQGLHYVKPLASIPGATVSNSGSQNSGHISVSGTASGMAAGAFTPQGVVVGHYDGVVAELFGMAGPCSGVCG